jgi:lysyl-tRNA synthetase class 2
MQHPVLPQWHPERLAARLPFLRRRGELAAAVRGFLLARGYTEVETPALVPAPGMEVHLRGFRSEYKPHLGVGEAAELWLRTSPEMALKRLLVAGAGPVFELARVWRNGEASAQHAPEFTMLEWYAPGMGMSELMDETELLLRSVAPSPLSYNGIEVDLSLPFERMSVAAAFSKHCRGLDILGTIDPITGLGSAARLKYAAGRCGLFVPATDSWEEGFFRLLLQFVEPKLGRGRATFLTHWPVPQAALSRRDPQDRRVALRFELFVAGLELANAFDELTDAAEQRSRFEHDVALRRSLAGERGWEVDEDFLAALEHGMPAGAGIALGFDRLAMLVSGATDIEDVMWLSAISRRPQPAIAAPPRLLEAPSVAAE